MEAIKDLETDLRSLEERMDKRLNDMEEKIDSMNSKLTQVVDAILGNPLTKNGGLVQKIEDLEKEITNLKDELKKLEQETQSLKEFKSRIYWTIGITVAIAAIIKWATSVYFNSKQ